MKSNRISSLLALVSFLLAVFTSLPPLTAQAQPPGTEGTVISSGMAPFTETWEQMQRREAEQDAAIAAGLRAPRPPVRRTSPRPIMRPKNAPGALAPLTPPLEPSFPSPAPSAPQSIGNSFIAINLQNEFDDFLSGYIPPDTMGAVGPNYFLEVINGSVSAFSKTGTLQPGRVSLDTFFTVTGGHPVGGAFDPRVLYDKQSGRWFAIALEFGPSCGANCNENNNILLAVSRTNDPTGTWDKYVIPIGASGYFTDFDTLGVDSNGVYFGMTMFPNAAGTIHAKLAATGISSLLAVSPSLGTVTSFDNITDMYSSPQPAHNHDSVGATDPAWFVSASNSSFSNVSYRTLTWSGGTPSISTTSSVTTPAFGLPPNAPASGSTTLIETSDGRLHSGAVIRNQRLWTARDVGVNSSGGAISPDRTAAEWIELNVSTTTASLVQSGRVYDPAASNPRYYYYPSIMVNNNGDAAMGFSGSKSTEFVGAYTCGRLAGDTPGTMGAVAFVKAGQASYNRVANGRNRWGDYSYTSLDPADDLSFWTIQEYATNIGSNIWGTWVAQLSAGTGNPTISNLQINGGAASTTSPAVTLTYTLSDFPTKIRTSTGIPDPVTGAFWSSWMTLPVGPPHTLNLGSGDGIREVFAQVKDVAGNISPVVRASILLDTNAPLGRVKINGGAATVMNTGGTTAVHLHLAMFDRSMSTSPLMRIKKGSTFTGDPDPDATGWIAFATGYDGITFNGTGLRNVYVQFKDDDGNKSAAFSASITVSDTGAVYPGTSTVTVSNLQLNGGAAYTTSPTVTLTYDVSNTNVQARYCFIHSDSTLSWTAWEAISSSSVTRTLTFASGDAPRQVYVQLKDTGGGPNPGAMTDPQSVSIILDVTNPGGAIWINNGAGSVPSGGVTTLVTLTMVARDNASGIDTMAINQTGLTPSGGDFVTFDPNYPNFSLNTPTPGTKNVYIWFKDKAGRISSRKSDSINVTP